MIAEPTFTIGIEEEYMTVDRYTRNAVREAPEGLLISVAVRWFLIQNCWRRYSI